jgi:hypothetical protein
MKNIALAVLTVVVGCFWTSSARADVWTPYVTITAVMQVDGDSTVQIFTYPVLSGTDIGSCSTSSLYLKATNTSPYPGYTSLSPYVMAAFLYNKQVSFRVSGCMPSPQYNPIVIGLTVQQ